MPTFPTTQTVSVPSTVNLTVRASRKNPDTIVVGVEANGSRKRVALVRVLDAETIRVRTLDGNPREASSHAVTQTVHEFALDDLSDDE